MMKPSTDWRKVPDAEAHERRCDVPEAMEVGSVHRRDFEIQTPMGAEVFPGWEGVCLHGMRVIEFDQNDEDAVPATRSGRPTCKHPLRLRSKNTGRCLQCDRDKARRHRAKTRTVRHQNPSAATAL